MTTVQKLPASGVSTGSGYGQCKVNEGAMDQFPVGLRVLVVDDDRTCLKLLEHMLRSCLYHVTTCGHATGALSLLRERKGSFDLVISDVHMPDIDGFKLLEHVGLEMDLPVIMMSADESTSAVMKGIRHGACDYLIKPVRMEELKNIWQHVVRKKWNENREHENSGSLDDSDRQKRGLDEAEYASTVNDGTDSSWKAQKKKRDSKEDEDEGDLDNDDSSASKKPRVVWSVDLHQQFVSAVNQLGIDKAVPKRILELMNVPGLTRENVASHLQKFRLYLKRLSGVSQHQGGLPNSYCGPVETTSKVNPLGRLDFQSLASSSQIPPQTLAVALQAEFLGLPSGSMVMPSLDQPILLQTSMHGPKYIPAERGIGFSQPLTKCHLSMGKQFPQSSIGLEDVSSGFPDWSANNLGMACPTNSFAGVNSIQNGDVLAQILPPKQSQPPLSESIHAVNVQPSCLITPSQSTSSYQVRNNTNPINPNALLVPAHLSNSYQFGNSPASMNQNSSFGNCGRITDYSSISSPPSSSSLSVGQVPDGHYKSSGLLNPYSVAASMPSVSSGLIGGNNSWRISNPFVNWTASNRLSGLPTNLFDIQGSGMSTMVSPNQFQRKNQGFVGKDMCIPSRFAVDDIECSTDNLGRKKAIVGDNASGVKQEIQLDFVEGTEGGNPLAAHFSGSDFMSIISK